MSFADTVCVMWNEMCIIETKLKVITFLKVSSSRFLHLRDRLTMVLSIDEWSGKVDTRFRPTDWDLMAKVVSVLQVYNFDIVFGITCSNFSVYVANLYVELISLNLFQ